MYYCAEENVLREEGAVRFIGRATARQEHMKQRPTSHPIDLRSIKAITFDLDGTLYPEYRMLIPTLAVAFRHPRILYAFSRVRREVRRSRVEEDFRSHQASLMARRLGTSTNRAAELTEKIIYGRWLNALSGMRPFRGLRGLILRLRRKGLKTALLSDMPITKKVVYLGLEDVWDCAYTSEETGALKPDPRAFERMISALGCDPRQIMYIGNNYEYDVVGAGSMGMVTGLISSRRIRNNRADFVFRNYRRMKEFLVSLIEI
jgi:putative hydrolase of the HAD superfamily